MRAQELLGVALDVFLERGFDHATVEEIAVRLGMSKRTIYAKYEDKPALFRAAVERAIADYTMPRAVIEAAEAAELADTLKAVARLRIANVATPSGIRLHRILSAQSYRFPDLFDQAFEIGAGPVIEYLMDLFERHRTRGDVEVRDTRRAAAAFLSLAAGGPVRLLVSGHTLGPDEIEASIDFAVNVFLDGVRSR
jgi:AcrR family transcriptional regulator